MDAAREYLEAQLPRETTGCEKEPCSEFCTALCCPVLSDCGSLAARSDDSDDGEESEPDIAPSHRLRCAKRSPPPTRRTSLSPPEARSRMRSIYAKKGPAPRAEVVPRRARPSLSSTISSSVTAAALPQAGSRLSRCSVTSQTSNHPSLRSGRVTYKFSQYGMPIRTPLPSSRVRRASVPAVTRKVSPYPFEVRIRPRRTSSVASSRRPSVSSSAPVWPLYGTLDASTASSLGGSLICSSGRTRSPVAWTLPVHVGSPLLSSRERLPMAQVAMHKSQIASGSTSTYSGASAQSSGTPPQLSSPAETPPLAPVLEAYTEGSWDGSTRVKVVRFRQGSASIIGSPEVASDEAEKMQACDRELNPRSGIYGGA